MNRDDLVVCLSVYPQEAFYSQRMPDGLQSWVGFFQELIAGATCDPSDVVCSGSGSIDIAACEVDKYVF